MNVNTRRNFVKGLGLTGLFLAAASGYTEAKERIVYKQDELPTKELEEQLNKRSVLVLHAKYGEEIPYGPGDHVLSFTPNIKPGTEKNVLVNIVPGPDGKLYVKENDNWRKI